MDIDTGKCVREAQQYRMISNPKMAEDFGVARQQIHRWRTCKTMHMNRMKVMADYFKMNIIDFIKLGLIDDK